jgi:hypothetical protein
VVALFTREILDRLGSKQIEDGSLRDQFYEIQELGRKADVLCRRLEARDEKDVALAGVLHRCARVLRELSTHVDVTVGGLSIALREKIAGL